MLINTKIRFISFSAQLLVIVGVAGLFLFARPVQAAQSVYEISDVQVDVTAESATTARVKAHANGEVIAFRRLLERLTLQQDHEALPFLPRAEIAPFILDFSVADEKTSSVRYLAKMSFRFNRKLVRQLLTDYALPFAETLSKPVLVLPVYEVGNFVTLWGTENIWLDAWQNRVDVDGLVPKKIPLGDVNDLALINARLVIEENEKRLTAISIRYGVSDIVVAYASTSTDTGTGRNLLNIRVTRYGTDLRTEDQTLSVLQAKDETSEAMLRRGIVSVGRLIEGQWKQKNLLRFDQLGITAVVVPIDGLNHWLRLRKKMDDIAVIRRTEMVLMTRDEVRINLHHIGVQDQLVLALRQASLDLVQEDNEWILGLIE